MAPFGQIYTYPNNPRALKVQAAGNLNGLDVTLASDFAIGTTNRTPEFLAKFPFGKVPAFEGADGTNLWESDAIAQYVAESGPAAGQLLGTTPAQKAVIRQWVNFADGEIMVVSGPVVYWRIGFMAYNAQTNATHMEKLERSLNLLENHLKGRTWVATDDKLSLADISVAAGLYWAFAVVIDAEMRQKYPTVTAYYERVTEAEGVKEPFSGKTFVEKRKAPEELN